MASKSPSKVIVTLDLRGTKRTADGDPKTEDAGATDNATTADTHPVAEGLDEKVKRVCQTVEISIQYRLEKIQFWENKRLKAVADCDKIAEEMKAGKQRISDAEHAIKYNKDWLSTYWKNGRTEVDRLIKDSLSSSKPTASQ